MKCCGGNEPIPKIIGKRKGKTEDNCADNGKTENNGGIVTDFH